MMRMRVSVMPLLAPVNAACGVSAEIEPSANSTAIVRQPPRAVPGAWHPRAGFRQMRIWPGNAPDGTFRPQPHESVQTFDGALGIDPHRIGVLGMWAGGYLVAQAWNDATDPVCNSLLYAAALDRAGVSAEIHLFANGGHAFAWRHGNEPVGTWPHLVELWLKQIKML